MNPPYDDSVAGQSAFAEIDKPRSARKGRAGVEIPPEPTLDDFPSYERYNDLDTPRDPRTGHAPLVVEPEIWDSVIPPPEPTKEMFHGVLGDLALQAAQGTEVNPVAAMAAAMTWLSAAMGRNRVINVGDGWHHLRLFTLHVGRSSRGGKGMALNLLERVAGEIEKIQPDLLPKRHTGGLSTREGLAFLIHDGYTEGKKDIEPIHDKRLFVVESEFGNILSQAKRDGNTLSTALRDAWDGGAIAPAIKSTRIWVKRPHIAMHGSITPTELREKMQIGEMSNGFANRFMIFWAERCGVVAVPPRTPEHKVLEFAGRLTSIIQCGLLGYPHDGTQRLLQMDANALAHFRQIYGEYARPHPGGELISSLLVRRPPMVLRIAGLFAMTDLYDQIGLQHITAADAWMDYYAKSVHMIFGPQTDQEAEVQRTEQAKKLLEWLRQENDWRSRTQINKDCFRNNGDGKKVGKALDDLMLERMVERREVESGGPRMRAEYRVVAAGKNSS